MDHKLYTSTCPNFYKSLFLLLKKKNIFAKRKSKFGVIVSKFQLNHLEYTVKLTSQKCETIKILTYGLQKKSFFSLAETSHTTYHVVDQNFP